MEGQTGKSHNSDHGNHKRDGRGQWTNCQRNGSDARARTMREDDDGDIGLLGTKGIEVGQQCGVLGLFRPYGHAHVRWIKWHHRGATLRAHGARVRLLKGHACPMVFPPGDRLGVVQVGACLAPEAEAVADISELALSDTADWH